MEIRIRRVGPNDAGLVAAMVAELLDDFSTDATSDPAALTLTATAVLAMQTVTGLVAHEGERPVGLVLLNECAAIYAGGTFGEITELYVRPEMRSCGVAALLLAEAERIGRTRGWRRIEVGAPEQPKWSRTLAFYLREGFVEVGPRLKKPL